MGKGRKSDRSLGSKASPMGDSLKGCGVDEPCVEVLPWRILSGATCCNSSKRLLIGVVALPCGGNRNGTTMNNVGSNGNYWSSSANDSNNAYEFNFNSTYVYSDSDSDRGYGRSVRLVQDLAKSIF